MLDKEVSFSSLLDERWTMGIVFSLSFALGAG